MARLSPEHIAELRALHAQTTAAVAWLRDHNHLDVDGHRSWDTVFDTTLARQDLRGMRMAARDFREMLLGLPASARGQLFKAVERATGMSLGAEVQKDAEAAARVIARGRVRNDREYYLLRSRLEYVQDDPSTVAETRTLIELLHRYRA